MSAELTPSEALFKELNRPSVAVVIDWIKSADQKQIDFLFNELERDKTFNKECFSNWVVYSI